ncbi:MAG: hypothetical protein ACLPZM_05745 [Thermoplasmata archaeon]
MASGAPAEELFPGGFAKPSAVLISGTSRSLLKWFAFAALEPYSSRVYWTDVRLPGEVLDPLDPMTLHAIPEEALYVLLPQELQPDDQGARQAEAAAATMLKSDETPNSLEGLVEFLRMPSHAQKLISSTGRSDAPSILVTANAHRLATVFSVERIAPLMKVMLESGTCQIALWAEAATTHTTMFDVLLQVEGSGSADWRNATVTCERGISTGPLASGRAHRLSDIKPVASILEKHIPRSPKGRK